MRIYLSKDRVQGVGKIDKDGTLGYKNERKSGQGEKDELVRVAKRKNSALVEEKNSKRMGLIGSGE